MIPLTKSSASNIEGGTINNSTITGGIMSNTVITGGSTNNTTITGGTISGSTSVNNLLTYNFFGAGYSTVFTDDALAYGAANQFYGTYPRISSVGVLKNAVIIFGPDWVNSWVGGNFVVDIWKWDGISRTNMAHATVPKTSVTIIQPNAADPSTKQAVWLFTPAVTTLNGGDLVNVSITTTGMTGLVGGDICVTLYALVDSKFI